MGVTDIDRLVMYRRNDDTELIPLDSPTTAVGASSTTIATGIAIGFTFAFDDVDYTTCALSPRGFLRFAGTVNTASNATLFASNDSAIIAPWWDDMETADTVGYIKHETQGTAPWRRFVAEWYCNLRSTYTGSDYARAKFQVVLHETWDMWECRYGDRETAGSPANTSDASVGFKGDTSVTTDNYRDLGTPSGTSVDDRRLGGSKTTSTAALRHYAATEWPSFTHVVEPAWPMCDRYVEMTDELFVRVQEGRAEALRVIANNVNWLYCRFLPCLVNFSPYTKSTATFNDPIYVVPVTPSADGLTYRVWIETYSGTGGNLVVDVDEDAAADPQPSTGADWSNITTETEVGTAIGYHSWASFDVAIDPASEYLRFKFTDNDLVVMSIMVAPVPLDHVDPLDGSEALNTYASGFVPMCIGQIRYQGAALHPEFLNRAWRNVAKIAADRVQALWAFGHSHDTTEYDFAGTSSMPIRRLGAAPCSIKGWPGQTADVVIYAFDDANNGTLRLYERGGGTSGTFDIDTNGSEFRRATSTITMLSDEPLLMLEGDPSGGLHVMYAGAHWVPDLEDADLIQSVTPPPKLEYLYALASRIRRLALHGYAMTGLASRLWRGGSGVWHVAWMIPPGCKAMRPKVARHNGSGKVVRDTSIYGDTSGAAAADEIVLPSPFSEGADGYPPDNGRIEVVAAAELYDASPASAGSRLMESPTDGVWTGPAREQGTVKYAVGMTLVPVRSPTG